VTQPCNSCLLCIEIYRRFCVIKLYGRNIGPFRGLDGFQQSKKRSNYSYCDKNSPAVTDDFVHSYDKPEVQPNINKLLNGLKVILEHERLDLNDEQKQSQTETSFAGYKRSLDPYLLLLIGCNGFG
jgi:hypothetical protein